MTTLLKARSDTRKKKKKLSKDSLEYSLLDAEQLSQKLVCNSLYGQVGTSTSPIFLNELGPCVTAIGRKMIYLARGIVLKNNPGSVCVYGDTDSIFIKFKTKGETKRDKIQESIDFGIKAADMVNNYCDDNLLQPQELEYEKTFSPLLLFTKKRYVGNKYEFDADKIVEQTNMGVVLKRRDNARIVKEIYQGVINVIMTTNDIIKAKDYYIKSCRRLLKGDIRLDYLPTSKKLSASYKNPNGVPHRVLADRISFRDPGNKPVSNDRISFIYINPDELKCFKCGEKIQVKRNTKIGYTGPKCLGCSQLFCRSCLDESEHSCKRVCWHCKTPLKFKNRRERMKAECNICGGLFCKECHNDSDCKTRLTNKILTGECIETPEYVKEHGLTPDYRHYLENTVRNPVEQIFSLEMKNTRDILKEVIQEDDLKKMDKERVNIKCFFPKSYSIVVDK